MFVCFVPTSLHVLIYHKNKVKDTHQDSYTRMFNLVLFIVLKNGKCLKYTKG